MNYLFLRRRDFSLWAGGREFDAPLCPVSVRAIAAHARVLARTELHGWASFSHSVRESRGPGTFEISEYFVPLAILFIANEKKDSGNGQIPESRIKGHGKVHQNTVTKIQHK